MTAWHAWVATIVGAAVLGVVAFTVGAVAILTESDRLGGLAALFGAPSVIGMLWAAVIGAYPPEKPSRSRADRRRLRDEEARIAFDREIRRMEREAGL